MEKLYREISVIQELSNECLQQNGKVQAENCVQIMVQSNRYPEEMEISEREHRTLVRTQTEKAGLPSLE